MVSGPFRFLALACAGLLVACASPPPRQWTLADLFAGPPDADVYGDFLAARYAGLVGDPREASIYLRRAYERSSTDPAALESAVFASLTAGEAAVAIDLSRGADASLVAASPSAILVLTVDDIAAGKAGRALARLRATPPGLATSDMTGFLHAWLTASAEGDVDAAVAMLKAPQSRRNSGVEAMYLQGVILASAGRDAEALARFDEAGRGQGTAPDLALMLHAQLLASIGDGVGARAMLTRRPTVNAASAPILAQIEAGAPVKPPRFSISEGAAVAIYLSSASGLARSSPQVMTQRMALALRLDPHLDAVRLLLTEALDDQQLQAEAIAVAAAVPASSSYYPLAQLRVAQLHLALDQPDLAVDAANAAVAASRRREILLGAGDIYRQGGQLPEAEAMFDEAVRGDQAAGRRDWRPLFARARVREQLGRWAEAEADAVAAIEIEGQRAELLNFLGYGWVSRRENVAEGLDLIRRAALAQPGQGYIIDSLGWAYFQLHDYARAVEYLEQAAELSPESAEIIDHLGDAYWRAGRRLEAGFEWSAAQALASDPQLSDAIARKLAHGLPDAAPQALAAAPQLQQ